MSLVIFVLAVITVYFYAGMRSYSAKLLLIPRNCIVCGLPVFEHERTRNDEASLNPFRLLRFWWRSRKADQAGAAPEDAHIAAKAALADNRTLKRNHGMSQVKTPYLGVFRSVHRECPIKNHPLSGAILERTIRSNLRVWQARVKLRMNYLTYRNRCLKLYCWIALFLYPSISKTILTIFNCQEVGDTYYLVADRRLICYNSTWFIFGVVAATGTVVWVVGIPFFFWLLIKLAQDRGVKARIKLLQKPQCRNLRKKWLREVIRQHAAEGVVVPNMRSVHIQNEELEKHMKLKNLSVRVRNVWCIG